MANVRYMGGRSATLGTKEIDANGIYNASSDNLDGYSSVTVDVPTPSGSVNLEYTGNGQYSEDVSQYANAEITVDVPIPTVNTQTKSITASTSQQTVTPDPGYFLEQVTVNPQQNTGTYTPASDTASNDMGPVNNYRYVDTSGMILPTGSKTVTIDSNGNYTENVSDKATVDITVNVPVSGDLGTKTIITNGTYQALDDNLDGYSEVTVNVPQNATLGIKTITNNGNYYATTDGYDGFSRVDVNVAGATLQTSKSVTATTSQQTVTPDVGYDGLEQVIVNPQVHTQTYSPADNTAANDMGVNNNYRYVDTSGMYTPSSITPSNSTPAQMSANTPVNPTANGYAIESYNSLTPTSVPHTVQTNSIIKFNGNASIVDIINSLIPYAVPQSVNGGETYHFDSSGVVVDYIGSKTPSNTSPPLISQGEPNIPTANGYLYSTVQPKVKIGTFRWNFSGSIISINVGFQPKKIFIYAYVSANKYLTISYDEDIDSTYQWMGYRTSSSASAANKYSISGSNNGTIVGIDSTGFDWQGWNTFPDLNYVAIG